MTGNRSFSGKNLWALVLGGSSGIGFASVKKLALEGMNVFVVYREGRARAEEFQRELEQISVGASQIVAFNRNALSGEEQDAVLSEIQTIMGESGKLKVLLHSIANGNLKRLVAEKKEVSGEEQSGEFYLETTDFQHTIHAMALSFWEWTSKIRERGLFAEDARVLGLTSEGNQKAWPYYAAVGAAKSTLESLCRSMAVELGPYGIRTNIIQSGITDTPSLRKIPGSDVLKASVAQRNPLGRMTSPEDIANIVYLLSLEEALWVNGAILKADGGESLL